MPQTTDEWLKVTHEFNERWNFPHCLGAIDGKHIVIQCPINSGTEFYNYKGTFSIVLMALVDANYMFTYVDIGCQGRLNDSGVLKNTSLWHKLEANEIMLPLDEPLPSKTELMPYVFIGDGAFSLGRNMMKPYSGVHEKGSMKRIFNYLPIIKSSTDCRKCIRNYIVCFSCFPKTYFTERTESYRYNNDVCIITQLFEEKQNF